MEVLRLLESDGSLSKFENDWSTQCDEVEEDFGHYAVGPLTVIRDFAKTKRDKEWAIAIDDGDRFMASAIAIKTRQKPLNGWTLRIREVTVCPLLDYGNLDENHYIDTLVGILNGALKLSERGLKADHIKLHLRSPTDATFFRVFGNTLDSKGVIAASEAHGAWLTISKAATLQVVK